MWVNMRVREMANFLIEGSCLSSSESLSCELFSISDRKVSLGLTGASVMFLDWDPKHNTLNPSTFQTLNIPVAFPQVTKHSLQKAECKEQNIPNTVIIENQ